MRKLIYTALSAGFVIGVGSSARAAIIASDSFLAGGTGDYTPSSSLNGQTATNGTTGYFTGAASGNQAPGWTSGTGAFQSSTGGLTNPNMPGGTALQTNDGVANANGNANTRVQYRDFASAVSGSGPFYFSGLLQESTSTYSGATTYFGVGPSQASGNYGPGGGNGGAIPAAGMYAGFVNGAITLFYNNAGTQTAETLVPAASVTGGGNSAAAYMVELKFSGGSLTPYVYSPSGALVNSPGTQAVTPTLTPSTDLGAFYLYDTSAFSNGSPSQIYYDELRFSSVESDVSNVPTPEPASLALLGLGGISLLRRRRR